MKRCPWKSFLELIFLELKCARIVESVRGAKGIPSCAALRNVSEIIRLIDGPLAPFGDAEQLRSLIDRDLEHRALYHFFLEVRNARPKSWSIRPGRYCRPEVC